MPIEDGYGAGGVQASVSTSNKYQEIVLAVDGATASLILQTQYTPRLSWWFNQTVGAVGATVQLEFGVRNTDPPGGAFRFHNIQPPIVLALGVAGPPINHTMPVSVIRATFTRSPGQATTIRYLLGCAA
jgi:hypothetical protein